MVTDEAAPLIKGEDLILANAHPHPLRASIDLSRRTPTIRLVRHGPLALRLRWRLGALQSLLDQHSFWAGNRAKRDLLQMLRGSEATVSAWQGKRLVGFGRATSDGVFRAVLWDVVVAGDQQGQGVGRAVVGKLLDHPSVAAAERVYLMTTESACFYARLGFQPVDSQRLMLKKKSG
jgi:ribosomal protein S18 acetylase RimI-like enzyme